MELEQSRIAELIARSRAELGSAAIEAAGKGAITADEAKALNFHLGVATAGQVLAHGKRAKKAEYLESIAEAIRFRRIHFETHKIIPMAGRLGETSMLALAVGEKDSSPLGRSELIAHDLVQAISDRRNVDPNFVIDQMVVNDLRWMAVSTVEKRTTYGR